MISQSLVEMVKCRWREFIREPSAFVWVVFFPILWMLTLGFAFSEPRPEKYGVGWDRTSSGAFAEQVFSALKSNEQIKLREGETNQLITLFQRGEISMVARIDDRGATYQMDPANPEAMRAKGLVDDIVQQTAGRQDTVKTQLEPVKAQGGRYVDFLIPGLLGLSIMTSSLFGIGMTIVSNRRENLLKRYLATPMRPSEYIVSQIISRFMVLAVEFTAIMLCGFLVFGFNVYGNYLSYIVVSILGAAAFTGISLLCASRTKSVPMVSGITNLVSFPMMLLSGVFFSKNNFPDWLRQAVDYLPLTALNDALRKIALEGQDITTLGHEMAVLGVFAVVTSLLAQKMFRWY